jgi:hypothetical protein
MRVPSKRDPRAPARSPHTRRRGRAAPPEQAVAWARAIAASLGSPDPQERERAMAAFFADLAADLGPYLVPGEMLEAFGREVEAGVLRWSPEARLCLARWSAARGDRHGAAALALEAVRLADDAARCGRPAERQRASAINHAASHLFYEIGDARQGEVRYLIGRYYSVLPEHRTRTARLPWRPGGGPTMHAPDYRVSTPPFLTRTLRETETVPPAMDEHPVNTMKALDLLHAIAPYVGLLRHGGSVARFLEQCEAVRARRDTLPIPPKPFEVRELARHAATPAERAACELLLEAARAYWGE